jgi:hypothetical protein
MNNLNKEPKNDSIVDLFMKGEFQIW